jgi:hypothetical protein
MLLTFNLKNIYKNIFFLCMCLICFFITIKIYKKAEKESEFLFIKNLNVFNLKYFYFYWGHLIRVPVRLVDDNLFGNAAVVEVFILDGIFFILFTSSTPKFYKNKIHWLTESEINNKISILQMVDWSLDSGCANDISDSQVNLMVFLSHQKH